MYTSFQEEYIDPQKQINIVRTSNGLISIFNSFSVFPLTVLVYKYMMDESLEFPGKIRDPLIQRNFVGFLEDFDPYVFFSLHMI